MAYDSPNAVVTREQFAIVGAAASTEAGKFRSFQAAKLKAVHAVVTVAGTSNSPGHAYTIKHGTTSIGLLAMGTQTAGSIVTNTSVNETLATLDQVSVTSGTDATGAAHIVYEFQVAHDAVASA